MEQQRIVRRIRYSEIDNINLTARERAELRRKFRRKPAEPPPFSLKKLQEGDNREWADFVDMLRPKLARTAEEYVSERLIDDAVMEGITNIYVSRHTYENIGHMIGSAHLFTRHVCFSWRHYFDGRTYLIEHVELLSRWQTFMHPSLVDPDDVEREKQKKKWKADMLQLITEKSAGLPPKWREWVLLQISGESVSKIWSWVRENYFSASIKLCIKKLKALVEYELRSERTDRNMQLVQLRLLMGSLNDTQTEVVRCLLDCQTGAEARERLGLPHNEFSNRLKSVTRRIAHCYEDFIFASSVQLHDMFGLIKRIDDAGFWQAIREGIAQRGTYKHMRGSRSGMRVEDITKKSLIEAHLLRNQKKMSWEEIGVHLKIPHMNRFKMVYEEMYPEERGLRLKPSKEGYKSLGMEKAREIRRIHHEKKCSHASLAVQYGVSRRTITNVLSNSMYKDPDYRSPTIKQIS